MPISAEVLARIPHPCPGQGRALPAALAHSPEQAGKLMRCLPAADAQRLRADALVLRRAQQHTRIHRPYPLVWKILGRVLWG